MTDSMTNLINTINYEIYVGTDTVLPYLLLGNALTVFNKSVFNEIFEGFWEFIIY